MTATTLRNLLGERFLDTLSPNVCIDMQRGSIWHSVTGQQFAERGRTGWRLVKEPRFVTLN